MVFPSLQQIEETRSISTRNKKGYKTELGRSSVESTCANTFTAVTFESVGLANLVRDELIFFLHAKLSKKTYSA